MQKLTQYIDSGNNDQEDGIEDAFTVIAEISEPIVTGIWIKKCFFYLTAQNKLNYVVKDKPFGYAFLERPW